MPSLPRSLAALLLLSALLVVEGLCGAAQAQTGASYGGLQTEGNFLLLPSLLQGARFGSALAAGDFDGDGDDDLAVGAPDDPTGGAGAGRVDVYLAHAGGLLLLADHFYGIAGSATGLTLATGDFDGNGTDEIAVGATGETVGAAVAAGQVLILEWSVAQQDLLVETVLHQGLPLLAEDPEAFDNFGFELASADWNGDGYDDLAVGVPFEDVGATGTDQGVVDIFYGFATGLSDFGSASFSQDTSQVLGQAAPSDNFGWSLASADFDGDGWGDLAIGVVGETVGAAANAGAVAVLYGLPDSGLSAGGNQLWTRDSAGIAGSAASGDRFGWDLAAGHWNDDVFADLAIGIPGDDPQGVVDGGAVHTLRGAASGLTSALSQSVSAANQFGDASSPGDRFGDRLASGNFDADLYDDLAIDASLAADVGAPQAGEVYMLRGDFNGFTAVGKQRFRAGGLASGPAHTGDGFGWAMAAGDFDGDFDDDLFIGLPGRQSGQPLTDAGLVQVLLGNTKIFGHSFEGGVTSGWSTVAP
jgi:hypothetical protein